MAGYVSFALLFFCPDILFPPSCVDDSKQTRHQRALESSRKLDEERVLEQIVRTCSTLAGPANAAVLSRSLATMDARNLRL